VASFNGATGAVTGVSSVNGSTGAISSVAVTTGNLSQFAATTSAQLAGVISDETGSGSLVFATSPSFTTPNIGVASGTSFSGYLTGSNTGRTGNIPLVTPAASSQATWAAYPIGYAVMMANASTANGTATSNYSYFMKIANRDGSGGWSGISIDFSTGDIYSGTAIDNTVYATWYKTGQTAQPLSQFAATTSAQFAGIISDEIGTGNVILSDLATNAQTASYTLVLGDKGKLVEMNVATANNLTVPLNSSVAYPTGTQINILQTGAGQTTVVATGGVTINATPGLKLRAQWSSATLIKRATDTWVLVGDISA
jgi:hypothetical protein